MCLEDQPLRPVEARAGLGYPHVAHARAHAVSPAKVAATSSSPQLSSDQSTDGVTKRQAVTPCTMAMTEHVSSLDAVPPAKTVAPLFDSIKSRAGFFIAWLNDCADYHARRLRRIQFRAARCGRRPVSGRSAPKPPGRPRPCHPTGDDVAPFLASALNDKFAAACGFSDSCYLSTCKDGSCANVIPLCQSEVALDSRLSLPIDTVLDGGYRITRVVGSGGFGITYAAEDINLGTTVALKEYYPFDFGDRDTTMSVRPKSERHKKTFDWGRSNFLQEARTLARFEHTSIVRVTRVFETNSTAYMVMRFEEGESFEIWLRHLSRPPTQDELDRITAPLLDALQMMHAENFLHRDIAPDNIIVRSDGTPVLLDFGAARRAVAEMSRALTGVVKAGYSPHEQYSSDGRQQGPWSDIYALGATLYRAVAGYPPEEVTLRVDQDHMRPATQAANGRYRPEFLSAIDACLKVRHSERPRSVAQLRPMLLDAAPPAKREPELAKARQPMSGPMSTRKASTLRPPRGAPAPLAGRGGSPAGPPGRRLWRHRIHALAACWVRRVDCGGQAPGCGHRGEPASGGRRRAATGGSDGSRPAPGCARR